MAVVEHGEETTGQMEFEEQFEGPGTVGAVKSDDMITGEEVGRRRGRRRDNLRRNDAKRSRSPEIWTRRGRGRADRPDMVCQDTEQIQLTCLYWSSTSHFSGTLNFSLWMIERSSRFIRSQLILVTFLVVAERDVSSKCEGFSTPSNQCS